MPLHEWSELPGWEGVHQIWIVELLYWVKPRLPAGYRAYIRATPAFAIDAPPDGRPDMGVRDWPEGRIPAGEEKAAETTPDNGAEEPDQEVAVATLSADKSLFIERQGQLIAAVELVSPRNKDRIAACASYTNTYVSYLLKGVHLLLVDVHRRPLKFSFPDRIAEELEMQQPSCPAPCAVSYRVGEPAPNGGRFLAIWRRPLVVGSPLPTLALSLSVHESVSVDLEQTYTRATTAAYLGS